MTIIGLVALLTGMVATTSASPLQSCPESSSLVSKYNWSSSGFVYDGPAENASVVTIVSGDTEYGEWTSTRPISSAIVKAGTDSWYFLYTPAAISGSFSNENHPLNKAGRPRAISNVQFCEPDVASTTTTAANTSTTDPCGTGSGTVPASCETTTTAVDPTTTAACGTGAGAGSGSGSCDTTTTALSTTTTVGNTTTTSVGETTTTESKPTTTSVGETTTTVGNTTTTSVGETTTTESKPTTTSVGETTTTVGNTTTTEGNATTTTSGTATTTSGKSTTTTAGVTTTSDGESTTTTSGKTTTSDGNTTTTEIDSGGVSSSGSERGSDDPESGIESGSVDNPRVEVLPATQSRGRLAFTGSSSRILMLVGAAMVLAGVTIVVAGRMKQHS